MANQIEKTFNLNYMHSSVLCLCCTGCARFLIYVGKNKFMVLFSYATFAIKKILFFKLFFFYYFKNFKLNFGSMLLVGLQLGLCSKVVAHAAPATCWNSPNPYSH